MILNKYVEKIETIFLGPGEVVCTKISPFRGEWLGAYGRGLVDYLARILVGSSVKDIAQHFKRKPMTISLGVKKIENLVQRDRELARRAELMETNLQKNGNKKYFITTP
jgi:hypothetical protein